MTRSILVVTACALAACGKLPPSSAGLGEACLRTSDCAEPFQCQDARCTLAAERACEPSTKRCNGDTIELCRATGDGWDAGATCDTGCLAGACREQTCEPGKHKCEGDFVLACLPSGAGWSFLTACSTSCDAAKGECTTPVCQPFETRCKPGASSTVQTCLPRGTGWTDLACNTAAGPAACVEGRCEAIVCSTVGSGASAQRETRCDGDVLQACSDGGFGWDAKEICEFGCGTAGGAAACVTPSCEAGAESCDGTAIMRCLPDRRGTAFVQFCPTGCEVTGSDATCTRPSCTPLARRCGAGEAPSIEQCRADGTAWDAIETCPQACTAGACVVIDSGCNPGDRRCTGREAEVCVRLGGATEWRFEERCLGTCSNGACDGAACGCAGGVDPTKAKCGDATRQPLVLAAQVGSGVTTLPADGVSRFLIVSEPIASATGSVVPDGTPVTIANDGESLLATTDQDAARPGLQRLTRAGRIDFVVKAPATARAVTISGTVEGRCSGTVTLTFTAPVAGAKTAWFAEDFTSTRYFDRAGSGASWDAATGRAQAFPGFTLGTGLDGDLTVAAGQVRDLWDEGYGRGWNVVGLGDADALLDAVPAGLGPGDEVLLVAVTGSTASAVGNYEFRRVTRLEGSRVVFEAPLRGVYGAVSNRDLGDQRVVLQRVPQLNNVTVEATGRLTSRSLVTGGSGALVLRARGVVKVLGTLGVAEAGLGAGVAQASSSTPALNRLLLGAGGAKAGGGIVYVAAGTLTLAANASAAATGLVTASSTAGSGGTIWLQAGSIVIGTDRVAATGTAANLAGRVRIDSGTEVNPVAVPTPFVGQNGAAVVQSTAAYTEPVVGGTQPLVKAASLLAALGGAGTPAFGAASTLTGITFEVSADDGANWAPIDVQRTFTKTGRVFRWRARLATWTDLPTELSAVAFKVDVN